MEVMQNCLIMRSDESFINDILETASTQHNRHDSMLLLNKTHWKLARDTFHTSIYNIFSKTLVAQVSSDYNSFKI